MSTEILIVDDHPFTRAGIRAILETSSTIKVIDEAVDGLDAITKVRENKPEIAIMDITMPNLTGIEATKKILKAFPDVKIIALSIHSGEQFVKEMLDAGALGYLLKDEAPEELLRAVEKVRNGEMFLSAGVTRAALAQNKQEIKSLYILQTKLSRPKIMDDYIIRQKIIDELENNVIKPLSVISAGAGYGKSVSVSEWLEQSNYVSTWLSLDKEHNNFRNFLLYFNAAIEKIFPGAMQETNAMLSIGLTPPFNAVFNSSINEICNIEEDFILVLDDFHVLSDKEIFHYFNEWLRFPPPNVHLSIITRRDLPLKINKLINSGRMIEIRMDDLSFSDKEIHGLFKNVLGIDLNNKNIKLLQDKTEGWIIGLRLTLMAAKDEEDIERIMQDVDDNLHSVSDYLLSEVLSKQPDYIIDQLVDSSILNRLCSELIDEIISFNTNEEQKSSTGESLIQWLLNSNMFLISIDPENNWYRYHHLFQELLQNQLRKRRTISQINAINLKASIWFESNKFIAEAIEHALKANEIDHAIKIIIDNWEDTFDKDHWYVVEEWLFLIPEKLLVKSSKLLMVQLWLAQKRHKVEDVPLLISLIEESGNELNETEAGYLAFARCMVCLFKGEFEKALSLAEEALDLIPKKQYIFRADTYGWWTAIMHAMGKGDQAVANANSALEQIEPPGEPIQISRRSMHRNFVFMMNADLPSLKKSINTFFNLSGNSSFMIAFGWYFKGSLDWWLYNVEDSLRSFENTIKYQYQCRPRIVIEAYICRALAFQELNRPVEAQESMNSGVKFAINTNDPVNIAIMNSGQVRLNLLQGELELAEEWLLNTKHTDLDVTMFWWIEVSAITQCKVLIELGTPEDLDKAINKLIDYEKYCLSIFNKMRLIEVLVLQSKAYSKGKNDKKAIKALKKALNNAAEGKLIKPFIEDGKTFCSLYKGIKKEGIHIKFIDEIVNKLQKITELSKEDLEELNKNTKQENISISFTRKEIEIVQCISKGYRNREIADKYFNSEETIKKHISNMFQKLNVHNRLSLVSKAKEIGLLNPQE